MSHDSGEKGGSLAEELLESLGLGDLVGLLKRSEVFEDRLEEVNERIRDNIDSAAGKKSPHVDFNFSIGSLEERARRRKRSTRPSSKSPGGSDDWEPKEKGREAFDSENRVEREALVDLFEEGDRVRILAMFPDAGGREDLNIEVTEEEVVLSTGSCREKLLLPSPVEDKPSVRYHNGIFDITLPLA